MTDTTETAKPITWAGGQHPMTLNHPWVRANLSIRGLPGDYGSTPAACLKRFNEALWSIDDMERVIELGLIGGGLSRRDAADLVERFVRTRPLMENAPVAITVLSMFFVQPTEPAPEVEGADNG
ncbi:MAG: gene transfer agent family protein [Rhizobiales bacterium]|nr:gene transfer agent family protein [Hyphomicrobiales bacterium]